VGWLDSEHSFTVGHVRQDLVDTLRRMCRHGVNRTRGIYFCDFCPRPDGEVFPRIFVRDELGTYVVGSAEIRVPASDKRIFAAPDMIVHYVTDHQYKPPDAFLRALESTEE
jgi:hypothetical protein